MLAKKWRAIETKKLTKAQNLATKAEINKVMKTAIFAGDVDNWISLKRVYGGTYRKIHDKEAWDQIAPLKTPRAKSLFQSKKASVNHAKRKNLKNKT
jgi:hypothetical protein